MKRVYGIAIILGFISFACGREEITTKSESPAIIASDEGSTLTSTCEPLPEIDLSFISYCKTLADGSISKIDLKPSRFVQDPVTCVVTSEDDGIRSTMVEMGFAPCES